MIETHPTHPQRLGTTSRVALRCALLLCTLAVAACRAEYETLDRITPGIFVDDETRAVLPDGVELRKVFDPGLELTKTSEGFVARLYIDAAGFCTIGYGHLIRKARCDGSEPAEFRSGIREPRGSELLRSDMEVAEIAVMTSVQVPLSDAQFAALADFTFNVGRGNFRSSTLLRLVNQRRHDQVPFQLRRWVKAGGKELPGLKQRRENEIDLYFLGLGVPRLAPPEGEDLSEIDIRLGE